MKRILLVLMVSASCCYAQDPPEEPPPEEPGGEEPGGEEPGGGEEGGGGLIETGEYEDIQGIADALVEVKNLGGNLDGFGACCRVLALRKEGF